MPGKIDWLKPVQRYDGTLVRVLCTDGPEAHYPVITVSPKGETNRYNLDGANGGLCHTYQLQNVPPPKVSLTRFIGLVRHDYQWRVTMPHESLQDLMQSHRDLFGWREVTVTEGDGL